MSNLAERRKEIVGEIYSAFIARDLERVAAVFDRNLADDVVLFEPESLPYGGKYERLETVKEFTGGLVDPQSPIDAGKLAVNFILTSDSDPHVIASVSFPWDPPGGPGAIPMGALELFTFDELKVVEMRVFLWDTAACIASLHAAAGAG
jgi:hypothetical protein